MADGRPIHATPGRKSSRAAAHCLGGLRSYSAAMKTRLSLRAGFFRPGLFVRWGVRLGVLALLVQCLVATMHQPARAATPFDDPAAWCLTGDTAPAADFGHAKAPLKAPPCAICLTLQAASGAAPSAAAVTPPGGFTIAVRESRANEALTSHYHPAAQPRAPPASA